VAS
jgi:PTH1 family peptidyl-tRNA hydrolase